MAATLIEFPRGEQLECAIEPNATATTKASEIKVAIPHLSTSIIGGPVTKGVGFNAFVGEPTFGWQLMTQAGSEGQDGAEGVRVFEGKATEPSDVPIDGAEHLSLGPYSASYSNPQEAQDAQWRLFFSGVLLGAAISAALVGFDLPSRKAHT